MYMLKVEINHTNPELNPNKEIIIYTIVLPAYKEIDKCIFISDF